MLIADKKAAVAKDYYDQLYDAAGKKLSQSDAGYDAVGMKDGMACAACHWFLSPDGCAVVGGDISPTGLSRLYMKEQPQQAYVQPVTVVDANDDDGDEYVMPMMGKSTERSIVDAVVSGVKSVLGFSNITSKVVVKGNASSMTFVSVKDVDGTPRLRFMAVVSNNFKDRESEIIPEAAHHEYVEWATKESSYPELWLWHAGPATRWGQADWLDVSDGFLVASGLVDKGYEYIAHNLEGDAKAGNPVGVSHGFFCLKSEGTIGPYRSFELSPLLLKAAANEWTAFTTLSGEKMAFSQQRREWLKKNGGISEEAVSALEQATGTVAKALKERGIEYKDMGLGDVEAQIVGTTVELASKPAAKPLSPLDAAIASITGIKSAKAVALVETVTPPAAVDAATATEVEADKAKTTDVATLSSKEFTDLTAKIDATNANVESLGASVKSLVEKFQEAIVSLSKSDDDKTAAFFKSKVDALPRGFQASAAASNTNDPLVADVTKQIADVQKNGWFTDMVMKGLEVQQ